MSLLGVLPRPKATHCYVAIAACGCVRAITVEEPDFPKAWRKDVTDYLSHGYTVKRVEIATGAAEIGNPCPHRKEGHADLFGIGVRSLLYGRREDTFRDPDDSPDFVSPEQEAFAARGYARINRWPNADQVGGE